MAKGAKKYYVVIKGHHPGIYPSWASAKEQVDGFQGAVYKAFTDFQEAQVAMKTGQFPKKEPSLDFNSNEPNTSTPRSTPTKVVDKAFNPDSISVDAACSGNPGMMEYRGVDNMTGAEVFKLSTPIMGTNNIGEFLAIVHALAWLKGMNSSKLIYSDSVNAINWIKAKSCRTKLPRTANTETVWKLIERAVTWLNNNSYPNKISKWETDKWGENPADFGRK
jgi:ribonuclease HI